MLPRAFGDRYLALSAEPVSRATLAPSLLDDADSAPDLWAAGSPSRADRAAPQVTAAPPGDEREGALAAVIPLTRCEGDILQCGGLRVDLAFLEVTLDGMPVPLTQRELALLAFFLRNPNRAFSREQLIAAVWPGSWGGRGRAVDVQITRLRAKLAGAPFPLETVRGVGYRFRASGSSAY